MTSTDHNTSEAHEFVGLCAECHKPFDAHNSEVTRLREALETADKEASAAHDAIWSSEVSSHGILHDSEREDSANSAIWRLHKVVRAALAASEGRK